MKDEFATEGGTCLEAKVIRDNAPYLRPHIPAQMLDFFDKLVETALTLDLAFPSEKAPFDAELARLRAEVRSIESQLNKAGVRRVSEKQMTSDRVYDLIHNGQTALSAIAGKNCPTCGAAPDVGCSLSIKAQCGRTALSARGTSEGVGLSVHEAAIIAAAVQLAPLLEEGWDEYDLTEDQNEGSRACDALVEAVNRMLKAPSYVKQTG